MNKKKYLDKLLTKYDKELLFKEFEDFLEKKYQEKLNLPISIFSENLSPFESVVKFLVENSKLGFSEIAKHLDKDRRVIWTTYRRASKKYPAPYSIIKKTLTIPLSKLCSKEHSIAELIVGYLKDSLNMKNSDVAAVLKKDQRTIWTFYKRYNSKNG